MVRVSRKVTFVFISSFIASIAVAQSPGARTTGGSAGGARGATAAPSIQKPIEIRGQSRNLNMTLMLNNRTEAIKFVEIRSNYRSEILSTFY